MLDRVGKEAIGRWASPHRRAATGRQPAVESLEGRQLMTAGFDTIANVTSPQYQGYQVPITGTTTHQQTYTVTSDNPGIKASIAQGRFLTISVEHTSSGTGDPAINGSMVFQLFDDDTPITTQMIEGLVNGTLSSSQLASGVTGGTGGVNYYVGKTINRIANGFPGASDYIVQGGSLNGDSTGQVFATPFVDEFNQSVAFTGSGQLAMANSGPDTNDSQFFITTGSPQFLSYHHTIFGQIVEGTNILNELTQVAKGTDGTTPVNTVTITGASVSSTSPDATIHLDTTLASTYSTANVTVTATDVTDGTTATQTFQATTGEPYTTTTLRPFIGSYDTAISVPQGQTAKLQILAVSPTPNDPLTYTLQGSVTPATSTAAATFTAVNTSDLTASVNASTGLVTITPVAGFTGTTPIIIGVRDNTQRGSGTSLETPDNYEYHTIEVTVPASTTAVNYRPLTAEQNVSASTGTATAIQLAGTNQNATTTEPIAYAISTQPTHGTASLDATTGKVEYTPTAGYLGPDAFDYTVTDPNSGLTSFATAINLTVTNASTGAVRFIPNSSTDTTGTLVVTPNPRTDGGTNVINVTAANGLVLVTVNGVVDQNQQTTANVDRIVVYGSKANDNITIDPSLATIATIDGGHGGTNILRAGAGQTREHGWFGKNTLIQGSSDNYQLGRQGIGDKFVKGTGSTNVIFTGLPGHFTHHLQHNRSLPTQTHGRFFKFASNGKTLVQTKNPYLALGSSTTSTGNATGVTGSTSTTRSKDVTALALAAQAQAKATAAAAAVKAAATATKKA